MSPEEISQLQKENTELKLKVKTQEEALLAVKGAFLTPVTRLLLKKQWNEYHEDAWKRVHALDLDQTPTSAPT